ncbi:MAG: 6-phosphofructokinase [Candidatus Omnitrophica bacterium]|nr:6-phosphofructokinase [Candidatus Omnitrophota bacterium]
MATRKKQVKRIGILTGGGDCPGLNAVIRAVARPAMTSSCVSPEKVEVYGFLDAFKGLVYNKYIRLTSKNISGILTMGGTILGTSNKDNPFAMPFRKDGTLAKVDMSTRALGNYKKLKLDALVCIGGDGTMAISYKLSKIGINIVGIPKTIDNDLAATDFTFGFDTAVTTATEAIDKIHTTAASHHRVMVVELMGRYAGWLTLYAGLAGGADIILLPEFPYELDKVCDNIMARKREGKSFSIVAVSEGARPLGGEMIVERTVAESHDPIRLGGIGKKVADDIEERMGIETRVTVLGHVQRGGSPTALDRVLSTRFGIEALNLVMQRRFGRMVCLRGKNIASVTLKEATNKLKLVTPAHPIVNVALGLGISFGTDVVECSIMKKCAMTKKGKKGR